MLKNNNNKYRSYIEEGIKFASTGKLDKAKSIFLEAININKKNYEAYLNISNIHILQNNVSLSVETLFTYIQNNKYNGHIINHLGKICLNYN